VKPFFNDVPLVGRVILRGQYAAFMVDHRSRTSLDGRCLCSVEFILIHPSVARAWGAPGCCAGHNRCPSRHRGRPPSTDGSGLWV